MASSSEPKNLTLSVAPLVICGASGGTITATATATGPGADTAVVVLEYPGGSTSGTGTATKDYTIEEKDAGKVLTFVANATGRNKRRQKAHVIKVTVAPNSMTATEAMDSDEFEAKVEPAGLGLITYEWLTGSDNGAWPAAAGNNPELNYSAPNASKTTVQKTRWFAATGNRRMAIDNSPCKYKVSCRVEVKDIQCEGSADLEVDVDLQGGTYKPKFTGSETILRAKGPDGKWRTAGQGGFRRVDASIAFLAPATGSQFFGKASAHEEAHLKQFNEDAPIANLFDANTLYNTVLSSLTAATETDLIVLIDAKIKERKDLDNAIIDQLKCQLEDEAFRRSNATEPHFLERDPEDWKPGYGCQ